ncbi:MAG: NUDIX domain-containing protein [Planctomycetes bacterium]|nr:NUDIX domain-containing protein [Planctomycetota bacterium]MBL7145254.1 NUDIX domain-containing protein [Phycisphaerae bacterium]
MDNYIELSFDGELIRNTVCRETAKSEGHSYGISYVFLTSEDSFLLQLRSFKKPSQPGLLDMSAGGHVELRDAEGVTDIDDVFQKAAVRELEEELEILLDRKFLQFFMKFHVNNTAVNGKRYRKYYRIYTCEVDMNRLKYKLNKKEVEDVKWMTRKEVVDLPVEKITKELERFRKADDMIKQPLLVTAAIITDKDKILLIQRAREPYENYWSFVGGCGAFGRVGDPFEAVKGEVKVDLKCKFNPTFFRFNYKVFDGKRTLTLFFHGNIEGEPDPTPEYVRKYEWFDLKEASKMKLGFDHNEILKKFIDKCQFG